MYDAIILGCGASGMVCAINLARANKKVAIIERQSRGGKKILASGNGHCNIFNKNISHKNFYGANKELIKSLINSYNPVFLEEFFNSLGLDIIYKTDGKAYPKSMQSKSVLELLEAEIKRLKIDIFYDINDLKIDKNFTISFKQQRLKTKNLIVATGNKSAPQLGGNSSGLDIAKQFNHTIINPTPALVPLISKNPICPKLAGVKIKAKVKLIANGKEITQKVDDLLFTKYGVSGLAILDLSLNAKLLLDKGYKVDIEIDFFSDFSKDEFAKYLKSRINKKRNLPLPLWFSGIINSKLSYEILKEAKLEHLSESQLNSKIIKSLVEIFKAKKIEILDSREFKYAEVAYGGVNSKEVDQNLQSKKQKGLFFIGEVLDIVGDRGGYNFYFAFSSALRVAHYLSNTKSIDIASSSS